MNLKEAIEILKKEGDTLNGYIQKQDMWIHRERFLSMIMAINFFLSLADKYSELETVLDAWHTIFGTTQLTHAQAKLEQAEKEAEKYKRLADKIEVGKMSKIIGGTLIATQLEINTLANVIHDYLTGEEK